MDLWMEGIRSWYNEQDYLAAMECWDDWIREEYDWHDQEHVHDNDNNNDNDNPLFQLSGRNNHAVELLVFMAGCHLDSTNASMAQTYIHRAIHACTTIEEAIPAIQEYISMTATLSNHQKARNVIQWAMTAGSTTTTTQQQQEPEYPSSSYWNDPYQRPGYIHPQIKAMPWYERQDHPTWCSTILEQHYSIILQEYLKLPIHYFHNVGSGMHRSSGDNDASIVTTTTGTTTTTTTAAAAAGGGEWNEVVLFGTGATPHVAPQTCALLQTHLPDAVQLAECGGGEIIFSVLRPKTKLQSHCGTTNLRLTAHLGLVVPPEENNNKNENEFGTCKIRVKDTWHTWKEGECIVFDDSFEHEVINDTTSSRAVLLVRFWHPDVKDRTKAMAAALQAKEDDILRRYNPPLPPNYEKRTSVQQRGLERTSCPRCFQTGYRNIRVMDNTIITNRSFTHDNNDVNCNVAFHCSCGEPID